MKVLTLTWGRPTPDSEPDGVSMKFFEIGHFRIVWGGIMITPKGNEPWDKEVVLKSVDGCFFYDGVYYSDLWVGDNCDNEYGNEELEEYDPSKAKRPM